MEIKETIAAIELQESLKDKDYLHSVGFGHEDGENFLIVYCSKMSNKIMREIPTNFNDFKVKYSFLGKISAGDKQ